MSGAPRHFCFVGGALVVVHPLLEPAALGAVVESLGYELVDVRAGGPPGRRTARIRVDVPGGGRPGHGVTTDDCRRVTRALHEALGAAAGEWELEVSSPGIERPVRFAPHWRRYLGHTVRLKAAGVRGRPAAVIRAVPDDAHVELEVDGQAMTLPLEAIREATLVVDWSTIGQKEAGDS